MLNASIKIINKDGFDNLSIRKIADLIGYSPTTIYIYIYIYYQKKAQIATDICS
ncbi:TetR family transcriptional regulator [Pseudolactococcus piscium]